MRRIAHLSDLHLGADPASQERLFDGLVNVFADQPVDLLVFTGDVFDSNEPSPSMVQEFLTLHGRIETALGGKRPTIILPGNHDRRGDGVFAPYTEALFDALRVAFSSRGDVQVLGSRSPFLAQYVPLTDFPCDVVAYDSTYLPEGFVSAGGVIRQDDLLQIGNQLARGDANRPVLFLIHHHLIPTPVTDTTRIDTEGRPFLQKLLVGKVLPRLVSNGDKEELTMTALGAGSAMTTLQTLGRAVVVLHGHKHYPTARLLKGFDGDSDLLITSAGSCGLATGWASGEYDEAPRLWPSLNFLAVDGETIDVHCHPWSPTQSNRRPNPRRLVKAARKGTQWLIEESEHETPDFKPVLILNEARIELLPSRGAVGRLDYTMQRTLTSHQRAWLTRYVEVIEGAPGAVVRELTIDTEAKPDAPCPAKVELGKDGRAHFRVEGAVFTDVNLDDGRAYETVELLNRSRAELAQLVVKMGPVKTTPFASVTNLTTGRERPYPLKWDGDTVTVSHPNCPARTMLRVYWPLER